MKIQCQELWCGWIGEAGPVAECGDCRSKQVRRYESEENRKRKARAELIEEVERLKRSNDVLLDALLDCRATFRGFLSSLEEGEVAESFSEMDEAMIRASAAIENAKAKGGVA